MGCIDELLIDKATIKLKIKYRFKDNQIVGDGRGLTLIAETTSSWTGLFHALCMRVTRVVASQPTAIYRQ